MSTVRSKWVALRNGEHLGTFDTEMECQMWIDNSPDAAGSKPVKLIDPWKKRGVSDDSVAQPARAKDVTLYLLDADGRLIGQTDTGHILVLSEEGGEMKTGMLVPIHEDGRVSFKSLTDAQLVPRLSEAFAMLTIR